MTADGRPGFDVAFYDALPDPAWVKAPSGRYTAVNEAFASALGRVKADIVGSTDDDLFIADTATRLRDVDRRAEAQACPVTAEELVLGHDGIPRWLEIRVVAIRDAHGTLIATCGSARDVSERKSSDVVARSDVARLRAVFDECPLGICLADPSGFIISANPAYQRLVGYTADELRHLRFSELSTATDAQESLVLFRDLIEGRRKSYTVEKTYRRKAGDSVRVRVTSAAARDDTGALGFSVAIAEDMTDQFEAAKDLRFQAGLLDAVGEAVIALDADGLVTAWNRHAERLYGTSRHDALGRPIDSLVDARLMDGDERSKPIDPARGGATERLVRRPDGTTFIVAGTSSPIYDAHGVWRGRVGVSRDITAYRSMEDQLRQAQRMEAVGRLVGGIAHDFNNLLTVIIAHADFLRSGDPATTEWRSDVDQITDAARRASVLTRSLLAFGRKQVMRPRSLDVNATIEDLMPELRRSTGEQTRLDVMLAADLPAVHADPGQLDQVMINLVANACDAMPQGGVLGITTAVGRPTDAADLRTTGEYPLGLFVTLSVSDTGIGMDASIASHIFEPFFTTKDPATSRGLGLSTVYGIVKQSGGSIAVESRPAGGTTITIYLPISREVDACSAVGQTKHAAPRDHLDGIPVSEL